MEVKLRGLQSILSEARANDLEVAVAWPPNGSRGAWPAPWSDDITQGGGQVVHRPPRQAGKGDRRWKLNRLVAPDPEVL